MERIHEGKRILITGVAGFVGAAMAMRLFDQGIVTLDGIDNLNAYYDISLKQRRLEELMKFPGFRFEKLDIANKELLLAYFQKARPQIVIHLAAQAGVRYSIDHPDVYIESNIQGFFNVLEACRHNPVEHLIYASSSSVYGNNQKVPYATKDRVDHPISLYAATKKSNELMAHVYSKLYGIPTTGLRFFTVYGPWGRPDMAYYAFTEKLLRGETIKIFNNGNLKRDFTYIDDITEGMERLIFKPPSSDPNGVPYKIYNIGNNQPVDLMEFIEILTEELIEVGVLPDHFNLEERIEKVGPQPGDVKITFADTSDLEKDIGFKPHTSLREGLKRFAQWYRVMRRQKEATDDQR